VVTICTASLTFNNSTFCPHSVFMCFVWIWEQTAIISLYNINWLVFITETECVYCAVRTGSLYVIQFNLNPKAVITMNYLRWRLKQRIALCRLCSRCHFVCADALIIEWPYFRCHRMQQNQKMAVPFIIRKLISIYGSTPYSESSLNSFYPF